MSKRKIDSVPSAELSTDSRNFSIRNCVKDLRTRRVFSLGSDRKQVESSENVDLIIGSRDKDLIVEPEIGKKEKKADLSDVLHKGPNCIDGPNTNGYPPKGILKRLNGSNIEIEELTHKTPPQNTIAVDLRTEKGEQTKSSRTSFSKSKSRIGLIRCPGSFGYRRLLPFLMEVEKNDEKERHLRPNVDSRQSIENHNLAKTPIFEISKSGNEELNSTQILDSVNPPISEISILETPISEISKSGNEEPNSTQILDSVNPPISEIPILETPISEISTSGNEEPNSTQILDSVNPPISEIPILETPISKISKSGIEEPNSTPILDSINTPLSEIPNHETPISEISKSENTNPNSTNLVDNSIHVPSLSPLSSIPETLENDEIVGENVFKKGETGILPKRGIIKKDNSRGCKGICTCLDCTSFRIHAEKAFEFSKKQMHEADEIIKGLVKELSSLRQLMEQSSSNKSHDKIENYQNELLKVACQRASIVEKLASTHTVQMFADLNAHCKVPGPRVAFSDCIEQRIFTSLQEDQA